MKNTWLSGFFGAAMLSGAIGLSTGSASAYSGYHSYRHYHLGYSAYRGGFSHRSYGQFGSPYRSAHGYPAYRSPALAYRHTPAYVRGVTTPQRFARGGGTGMATFYDPAPRGRGLTAAHLSLPLGTQVRVTNLSNRRSVVVRIADRGPQAWTGRILDLSRTAAYSLGMVAAGVVPVSYQVVN